MDPELTGVTQWLAAENRIAKVGVAIRSALDWVIDGARTRRYCIEQLEVSEKIYLGNRVEHEMLHELGLINEGPLDTILAGTALDVKFSLTSAWMIPPEALGEPCVIVTAQDDLSQFSVGVIRADAKHLGKPNRDGKRGVIKKGQGHIQWVGRDCELPKNFLLHLSAGQREHILSKTSGAARVIEVFRTVLRQPIPTNAIDTLAVQRDPSKRIRQPREVLAREGIKVLGWRYDRREIERLGFSIRNNEWISIPGDA